MQQDRTVDVRGIFARFGVVVATRGRPAIVEGHSPHGRSDRYSGPT